jgi:hypothetical protein
MAAQLSNVKIIRHETLSKLVDTRMREAETLVNAGLFAGCVYLAGYAVECQLKLTICSTLRWEELRATFKTHCLELLLLHSGFDARMRQDPPVVESFAVLREMWKPDTGDLRYGDPSAIDEPAARLFLRCATDSEVGVIPWLQKMTS